MSGSVPAPRGSGSPLPRRRSGGRRPATSVLCQVTGCSEELVGTGGFYRRYRVCKQHSQSPSLLVDGIQQRFCQQCARFHPVDDFEPERRSCKAALERHRSKRRSSGRSGGSRRKRPRTASAAELPACGALSGASSACKAADELASKAASQASVEVQVDVVEVAPALPAAAAAAALRQAAPRRRTRRGGARDRGDGASTQALTENQLLASAVAAVLGGGAVSSGEACCHQSAAAAAAAAGRPSPATTSCGPAQTVVVETTASLPSAALSPLLDLMDSASVRCMPPPPAAAPACPQAPPAPPALPAMPAAAPTAWPQADPPPALAAPPAASAAAAPATLAAALAPSQPASPAAAGCASWAGGHSQTLPSAPMLCEQFSSSHYALLHPPPAPAAAAPLCAQGPWPPASPAPGLRVELDRRLPLFMPVCEAGGSTSGGIGPFQSVATWGGSAAAAAGAQPASPLAPVPSTTGTEASIEGWIAGVLLPPEPQPHTAFDWRGAY